MLHIVHCILCIAHCILYFVYCILHIVYCMLYIVYCTLYVVFIYFPLHIVCYILCIAHCTLYCKLYVVYCTLHYISYSVFLQCTVYCIFILNGEYCLVYTVQFLQNTIRYLNVSVIWTLNIVLCTLYSLLHSTIRHLNFSNNSPVSSPPWEPAIHPQRQRKILERCPNPITPARNPPCVHVITIPNVNMRVWGSFLYSKKFPIHRLHSANSFAISSPGDF